MERESGVSTKPVFPRFLLPGFRWIPFMRLRSALPSSASESGGGALTSSSSTTIITSPDDVGGLASKEGGSSNGPPARTKRLSRTAEDTIKCGGCSTDLAFTSQIVSKGFTGRHGRAVLVDPTEALMDPTEPRRRPAASTASNPGGASLLNIRTGKSEHRQLVTGWHTVADISCLTCNRKLGWKYVEAVEESQKYKVGKFILEMERTATYRSWNDVLAGAGAEGTDERDDDDDDDDDDDNGRAIGDDGEEIEFDSEDEDECEDLFAGMWDAKTVAERRRRRTSQGLRWRPMRR